jgi:RNA polymerase sigma-70 factor (ECF subfamily)
MSDHQELIDGCIAGDNKSQKAFYDLFSRKMYVVCLRYAKSDHEAEDVLQESFIKIFKSIGKFRGESRLEYWVKRIVINTALNHQRNKLYMYPMVDVEEVKQTFNHERIISDYHFEELLALVKELPSGCRVIFNLFGIEGYSHKEIGEMLNISEGTSKSQYSRAKKLLQQKILKDQASRYEKYR